MAELLTDAERKALALTGELANLVHREVIVGPQQVNDWNEFAQRIHAVQHMIMAQAAARAYPDEFRLLGTTIIPWWPLEGCPEPTECDRRGPCPFCSAAHTWRRTTS